ncbi:MAG: hypothetical protein EBS22_10955, partial [Acidimicrobiia bacterium]|nr:hypothetical protein [Acidimicrobiia bacterium]
MHIGDTPDEAAFRAEARTWLGQHARLKSEGPGELGEHDLGGHIQKCRDWQRVLFDNGWAGITWPKQFGGRGASAIQSAIFAEEMASFDVSTGAFAVSIGMVGPTLIAHGTPEQQERHLAPILLGDEVWCQHEDTWTRHPPHHADHRSAALQRSVPERRSYPGR